MLYQQLSSLSSCLLWVKDAERLHYWLHRQNSYREPHPETSTWTHWLQQDGTVPQHTLQYFILEPGYNDEDEIIQLLPMVQVHNANQYVCLLFVCHILRLFWSAQIAKNTTSSSSPKRQIKQHTFPLVSHWSTKSVPFPLSRPSNSVSGLNSEIEPTKVAIVHTRVLNTSLPV